MLPPLWARAWTTSGAIATGCPVQAVSINTHRGKIRDMIIDRKSGQ
jgi:hypothetical protein